MMIAVAIDGPAGAGKSTIARKVSEEIGFIYVDTGALYRTIGYYAILHNIDPEDKDKISDCLDNIKITLKFNQEKQCVFIGDIDVSDKIRTPEISMAASAVSAIPSVRKFLLDLQKNLALENNVIMDGRDIGTVVLPNADIKIFLTASSEERAKRRYADLKIKDKDIKFQDVLNDIKQRDFNDINREIAPLKPSDDAIIVDTTGESLEQSVSRLSSLIRERI